MLTAVMLGVIMLFPDLTNGQIRSATKDPRALLFNIELKFDNSEPSCFTNDWNTHKMILQT